MHGSLVIWAVCAALGSAVIALPDSDQRLFWLSQTHGRSAATAPAAVYGAVWALPPRGATTAPTRPWPTSCSLDRGDNGSMYYRRNLCLAMKVSHSPG